MQNVTMKEIDLYNTLLAFKKTNGGDALAALLRKIGVKLPGEIDASQFPEIEMLCKAGTRGLNIIEGEDDATGASDALDKDAEAAVGCWGGVHGVDIADAVAVVRGAPSLAEGFNRLATAVHARGK